MRIKELIIKILTIKEIAIASRIALGVMFIFSGFVKGIDPWGSTYKFIDYFTAFNMMWMHQAAFILAIVQNAAEFVIGVALVLGLRMRETAWGALLFMLFFTPLTFILALTNPVTDCGCFGDALILTNWETFFKNLVMMVPTVIIFLYRNKYRPAYRAIAEWGWVAAFTVLILWVSIHCYRHLPWIDFRPYHIGADIPGGMTVPEGMPTDVYETILYYEKDGVVKEFTQYNFPWDDTTWIWKSSESFLVVEGYKPPIQDFSITNAYGFDITEDVLADYGYTFLLVAHQMNKSNKQALKKAEEIANYCNDNGHRFYCLTASPSGDIEQITSELGLEYEICTTDDITLKTIVRANPGLLLLQNGTVIGKWHNNDMPEVDELKPNLLSFALKQQAQKTKKKLNQVVYLAFVFIAFTFFHFRLSEKTEN